MNIEWRNRPRMLARRRLLALSMAIALSFGCSASAQTGSAGPGVLDIEGQVRHVLHLTVQDLKNLPREDVGVSFLTEHGQEQANYAGALLWTLLGRAEIAEEPRSRDHLRKVITVTGRDGYTVAVSMGELDPNFEGKQVIIAYERNGEPNPETVGLRLVVPGDKHGGRSVRDVVRVEVK